MIVNFIGRRVVDILVEVVFNLGNLVAPKLLVQMEQLVQILLGYVETPDVYALVRWHEANWGFARDRFVVIIVGAVEYPLEYANVLAKTGPQELALAVLGASKPIDVKYFRHSAVGSMQAEPVLAVVAKVVAEKRPHRKRIV